jgi:type I restriction enzyme R subunit
MPEPEQIAREKIDHMLKAAGWIIQDRDQMNLVAGPGVAVREFSLETGYADYLLFTDGKACGVIEAKPYGTTLSGVADQSGKYITGLPEDIPHVNFPLPFAYESTGMETYFRDERDPDPRSRLVFSFHHPETLAEWAAEDTTLRQRLRHGMPSLITTGLWKAQIEAVANLEVSLADDKPRALIQMATGSGKTYTAVTFLYRLIKFAGIRRALFLVDRNNLGKQTLKEFQNYITPDDGRKFSELYNVQRLTTNSIDKTNQVVITTIQRLYSMLKGEDQFDMQNEEGSLFESMGYPANNQPMPVVYNPNIPIETFDVIVTDECHRSIYNLWRQVLEYFDAHLIGLTATPSTQTFAFFNSNLVMEYARERAVADGVNVDGQVYTIRTRITQDGSTVEAGYSLATREKMTRARRWQELDDDLVYSGDQLDKDVVATDQIRTVVRTYRDKLFTELFPGRTEVPKTLVFAKDDSHAEDIVHIIREEFGKVNEFCKKITYRSTGTDPEQLIQDFRNSYNPRIAVSVDMIATGTDIKPLEVLVFLRMVKSRTYFEQMVGRGTRVITPTDLRGVTPDAHRKTHFIVIDAVGVLEGEKVDPKTLERKPSVKFPKLLERVAVGVRDENTLLSLAGRLARLAQGLSPRDAQQIHEEITAAVKNAGPDNWQFLELPIDIHDLSHALLDAFDPDVVLETAQTMSGKEQPSEADKRAAGDALACEATQTFVAGPGLRNLLARLHQRREQVIDDLSLDEIVAAGFDQAAALQTIQSFKQFIEDHKDEIDALNLLYERPARLRELTFRQIQELSERIQQPPYSFTTEALWYAYAHLKKGKVRGSGARRVLTDLISLVRHTLQLEDELVPFPERVHARYRDWLSAQTAQGVIFTEEQRWWLDRIAERVGVNLKISIDDFEYGEFFDKGGSIKAKITFSDNLVPIIESLNMYLVE